LEHPELRLDDNKATFAAEDADAKGILSQKA
jgi:hypothetical protein